MISNEACLIDIGNALLLALQTLASDVMDSGIPVPYRQELQSQLARRFAEEARANILPNFSAERGDWKEGLEILSGKVEVSVPSSDLRIAMLMPGVPRLRAQMSTARVRSCYLPCSATFGRKVAKAAVTARMTIAWLACSRSAQFRLARIMSPPSLSFVHRRDSACSLSYNINDRFPAATPALTA